MIGVRLTTMDKKIYMSIMAALAMAANTAKNLGEIFFTLAVALFILFLIYRDGERILSATIAWFASNPDKARHYLRGL